MAVRTFAVATFTTSAVADTTNIVDNNFMVLQGAAATQRTKIKEVYAGGQEDATTSPQVLLLARDTTAVATPTALGTGESDEADDPATAPLAAPVVVCTASGTQPQRGKRYLANLSFNALGGLVRLRFPYGEEPAIVGSTQPLGEVSLSGFTGTIPAAIGAHIKYETL